MKRFFPILVLVLIATLVEAQVSKSVEVVSAGTLSTVLTPEELSTVTNLTISGTINAVDFKTMRDNMNVLIILDISTVHISAYTGTNGPAGTKEVFYPANCIPQYAFYDENATVYETLTTITFPKSIRSIGIAAFEYSLLGGNVVIPDSVQSIGNRSFHFCNDITNLTLPNSLLSIGDTAFKYCSGLTVLTIPNSVHSIGKSAFDGCSGAINLSIGDSVLTIGANAFNSCTSLTGNLTIGKSVTLIGNSAFSNCRGFNGMLTIGNSVKTIEAKAFISCDGFTNLSLGSSVSSIGASAFDNCYGLVGKLVIPNSITKIESSTFYNCPGFYNIQIPNTVESIGSSAFAGCSGLYLSEFQIPNSVKSIGDHAFSSVNVNVRSLILPASVNSIGAYAFYGWSKLSSMYVYSTIPIDLSLSTDVFAYVDKNYCVLNVPTGTSTAYKTAAEWKNFTKIVEMPTGFKPINQNKIKVTTEQGKLMILNSESGDNLKIYTLSGIKIKEQVLENKLTTIALPKGVYVLEVNNCSEKAIIK